MTNGNLRNLIFANIPPIAAVKLYCQVFQRYPRVQNRLFDGPMIYKTYLKTEHSDENIEFWLACKAYEKITSQRKRISVARKLFTHCIQPQVPNEINIDSPARNALTRNIREPKQSCFDEAQRIIYTHMERDSYPQFLESNFYKKLKDRIQTNGNNSVVN